MLLRNSRLFVFFLVVACGAAGAQTPANPLGKIEVLGLLAAGSSPSYVAHLVKSRGIEFFPGNDYLRTVGQAGGEGVLLETLRSAERVPPQPGVAGDPNPALLAHLAICAEHERMGAFALAEPECRAALALDSGNDLLARAVSHCLRARESHEKSAERLADEDSEPGEALEFGSEEELSEGENQEFHELLGDAGDLISVKDACAIVLAASPNFAPAHAFLANALFIQERKDEALAEMREAVRLEPGVGKRHAQLAKLLEQAGQHEAALAEWREALRREPANLYLHVSLATLLKKAGDLEGSLVELREAERWNPDSLVVHSALASFYEENGDRPAQVAELREMLRLRPEDSASRHDLANLLEELGNLDGAAAECYEALQQDPNDFYAHETLASVLVKKGEFDGAKTELQQVLRIRPEDPVFHSLLGYVLLRRNEFSDAAAEFREAIRLDAKNAAAHNNLAWLYATSPDPYRNPAAALEHARRAVELTEWKVASAIDTLAEAFYVNGRFEEAVKAENKATELEPSNEFLKERLTRFRRAIRSSRDVRH